MDGHARPRLSPVAALVLAATAGIAIEATVTDVRLWLWNHSFTNGILVGTLLISATYLIVERALEAREAQRWTEASRPLLRAIAAAAAGTDAQLRAAVALGSGTGASEQAQWLETLLERYQAALSGTPELLDHWHAALSLAQHARAAQRCVPPEIGARYEGAWQRFKDCFSDVHDFTAAAPEVGATWVMPAVRAPAGR